jgi:outer membrane protein
LKEDVMQIRGKQIKPLWLAAGGAVLIALVVVLIVWAGAPAIGQSFSIGYVDMQKALDSHPRRASSEKALQEFFQAKQREFQSRSKTLAAVQRQELDRQLQQQFVEKREELLSGLDKDIRTAVDKVAKDRGVSIVLDRGVVLYGGTDLTEPVIAQLTGR